MKASTLRRVFNLWPPFLFCGIRVEVLAADWRYARVRLKLRWYNRNYVRSQFGGNLFSMTDPFWMVMVMEALQHEYIVWDKAGAIDFVAPGKADVFAEFRLDDALLDELRAATANGERRENLALVRDRGENRDWRSDRASAQATLRAPQAQRESGQ